MQLVYRWGGVLIAGAWSWIALVLLLTFWRAWDIPQRLPEINEIATRHLFLFPVSLVLFLTLSWFRQQRDQLVEENPRVKIFPRWTATVVLWLLVCVHPASCGLYPAVFNLDTRTVDTITAAVSGMQVGMPRGEVEQRILELDQNLPISMQTDSIQHQRDIESVRKFVAAADPAERQRLWPQLARATLVFVPSGPNGTPWAPGAREEIFQRRVRASSDIGVDRIKVRYGPTDRVEEIIYSSNRQLTEVRGPCTIHMIVPAPPEASFPYPCP